MAVRTKIIQNLLKNNGSRFSIAFGYAGMLAGLVLLLLCLQLFMDIQTSLRATPSADGFDYISISKTITNANMGANNQFTQDDIETIRQQPEVAAISELETNQFYVRASAGNTIPFSTDMFLESLDNNFIDTVPPDFSWQVGQQTVPVIFSSELLEMYNVFAPAQGLPQISPETLRAVNLVLECEGPAGKGVFRANVVALSDRINSILVPRSFMRWSNKNFAGKLTSNASRLYLKVRDANDPKFINWMEEHGYYLNSEKFKYGKLKGILQGVVGALAILGGIVFLLALLLLSFAIQLNISKGRDHLILLHTLGYNRRGLASTMAKTWLPVYLIILLLALGLVQLFHFGFVHFSGITRVESLLHWSVFTIAALFPFIIFWLITSLIRRELRRIL